MTTPTLFGGAAIIGLLTSSLNIIKSWAWKFVSLAIARSIVAPTISIQVGNYFWRNFKRSPFGEHTYSSRIEYVKPKKRVQRVAFEIFGKDTVIFWKGIWPIMVKYHRQNNSSNSHEMEISGLIITSIRGTFDIESVIIECLEHSNELGVSDAFDNKDKDRFYVSYFHGSNGINKEITTIGKAPYQSDSAVEQDSGTRFLKWKHDELGEEKKPGDTAFSHLAFPSEIEEIKTDIIRWKLNRDWYFEKIIPWRRGWCLTGKPGTGKSSLVKALAQSNKLPLYVFDVGSMDNTEFGSYWERSLNNSPCMVLIEDIDAVFCGRENILGKNGGGLTFDFLLNTLSGVCNAEGIFLVITTNHPEHLDPALGNPKESLATVSLSTRPGRIDRMLHLSNPDEQCRRKIANRILSDCPNEIEQSVLAGSKDSGAQFQERCSQIALKHFWK